jgi:hypothetical protein
MEVAYMKKERFKELYRAVRCAYTDDEWYPKSKYSDLIICYNIRIQSKICAMKFWSHKGGYVKQMLKIIRFVLKKDNGYNGRFSLVKCGDDIKVFCRESSNPTYPIGSLIRTFKRKSVLPNGIL